MSLSLSLLPKVPQLYQTALSDAPHFHGCPTRVLQTQAPRFRFFPAIYLTMQIVNLLVFYFPGIVQYHTVASYMLILVIASLLITRPYKVKWHNMVNIVIFTTQFLADYAFIIISDNLSYPLISHAHGKFWISFNTVVMVSSLFITSFYGLTLGILQILPSRFKAAVKMKILNLFCRHNNNLDLEESLPYRLRCDI